MRRHKTTARHGDIFDPLSFEGDRDSSSLGDALAIDLVGRFAAEVEASMGDFLPVTTLLELRDLDHVRPLLFIPLWMEGMLERTCPSPAMRKRVKTLWDRLADEFLGGDFLGQREHGRPAELIDGLALALKFGKRMSRAWSGEVDPMVAGKSAGRTAIPIIRTPWARPISATAGRSTWSTATRTPRSASRWTPAMRRATSWTRCISTPARGGGSMARPGSPRPNANSSPPTR